MFSFLAVTPMLILMSTNGGGSSSIDAFASTTVSTQLPVQEVKPAPRYSALTLEGKPVSLEEFEGKPVLLNVWATWCIPCREEMPALESLHSKFADQGLQVIGVSVDGPGTSERISSFIDKMGITYTILHDPDDKFSRAFRTIGVPESFLISANGSIVHTWKGPFDAMAQETQVRVTNLLPSTADSQINTSSTSGSGSGSDNQNQSARQQQEQEQRQLQQQQPQQPQTSQRPSLGEESDNPSISGASDLANYQVIGYPIAFGAGILSFFSPCILPLIPSFVAFVTGMSIEELVGKNGSKDKRRERKDEIKEEDNKASDSDGQKLADQTTDIHSSSLSSSSSGSTEFSETSKPYPSFSSSSSYYRFNTRHTALIRGLLFIAGFSIVFVALGASITAIGSLFFDYSRWIEIIGGILLVIFGLSLLGVLRIPGTEREWKFHFSKRPVAGHIGSLVIGMGFGAGWTPCIGPILASILAIAASSASITTGITLLAVYSAGLAVPFIISTLAVEKFITAFKQIRRWLPWINRTSAALLIIVGIMLLTGILATLTGTLAGLGMPLNFG